MQPNGIGLYGKGVAPSVAEGIGRYIGNGCGALGCCGQCGNQGGGPFGSDQPSGIVAPQRYGGTRHAPVQLHAANVISPLELAIRPARGWR
jgi:hypothetical protein